MSSKRGSLESPYTQKTKDPTHPYSLFGISHCHCHYLRRNVPPGRSYQSQIFFELASGGISGKHRDKCWCCLLKFSCLEPIKEMVQNNTKFICNRSRRPALSSKGNRDVNLPRIHTKPTLINRTAYTLSVGICLSLRAMADVVKGIEDSARAILILVINFVEFEQMLPSEMPDQNAKYRTTFMHSCPLSSSLLSKQQGFRELGN